MIVSTYNRLGKVDLPAFSGTRIMMMPVRLGDLGGIPTHYQATCTRMFNLMQQRHIGQVGYLTIDERRLMPGKTLRRPGLHVDGYYHGRCGGWGGGGGWGSVGNGMLTLSSTPHCRAYAGVFDGEPGWEGECDHIQVGTGETFEANRAYWVDGACVHESMPVTEETERQFVRLSMPSNGPWFENYTPSPVGVMPSADILPPRNFN